MTTFKQNGNFRLKEISRCTGITPKGKLVVDTLPVSEGLDVEFEYDTTKHFYVVVGFIKFDSYEDNCSFSIVGDRLQQYVTKENYDEFIDLVKEGYRLVQLCNSSVLVEN